ncbi:DUF3307 domain-containing protein [Oricola sp.]|uniref:DUF3307 domain-containing protein n=1 Tax=Oricola sp. TaxID=1979950 RepID=UPI0025D3C407|nr:DUF3307 domain-containing protein [Oricola sp.]MCI5077804.1 DUF3307 domain-containing protein [Oricola sp.]
MIETFTILLLAHLLADFVFQPERFAKRKGEVGVLTVHIAIVTVTAFLALGYFAPMILVPIAVTHFVIDLTKSRLGTFNLRWFLGDQGAHIAVVAAVSILAPADLSKSLIYVHLNAAELASTLSAMMLGSGFILAVLAGTYGVELFVKPHADTLGDALNGLPKGGRVIGQLERFLVFIFSVTHNPAGIGFLIAAKSILRFGDISNHSQRKVAEYVIIGTLCSFSWAIGFSQLAMWAAGLF